MSVAEARPEARPLVLACALAALACHGAPPPPPVLGPFPDFTLTDQAGRRLSAADLRGKVWIADFIFTRCPTICPRLTDRMAAFEAETRAQGDRLRFVSFSVDPENDTPAALTAFAGAHHANLERWSFLTGPIDAVAAGAKLALERDPTKPPETGLLHGTHFLLVDAAGQIRGYYDSADEDGRARLRADLGSLLK